MKNRSKTVLLLILHWIVVGVPFIWGILLTIHKSLELFF